MARFEEICLPINAMRNITRFYADRKVKGKIVAIR
jgi:hypothetical protein